MPSGDGAHRRDVDQAHVGIGRRFKVHHARRRIDGRFEVGRNGEVDVGHLDAELRQTMVEVAEGAAVERFVGDDFVARRKQGPQQRGRRALARGRHQCRLATFEFGQSCFEQGCGGIADARIDEARLLARKACSAVLDGGKGIGRAQVYRRVERAMSCIGVVTVMDGAGGEAGAGFVVVAHGAARSMGIGAYLSDSPSAMKTPPTSSRRGRLNVGAEAAPGDGDSYIVTVSARSLNSLIWSKFM